MSQSPRVALVTVDSPAEEREVCRRLASYERAFGCAVAPVSTQAATELAGALRSSGADVSTRAFSGCASHLAETRDSGEDRGSARPNRDRPSIVIFGRGVSADVAELLGALCRATPVALSDAIASPNFVAGECAILLVHSVDTPLDQVLTAQRLLTAAEIDFGIISAASMDVARFAILKAMLAPHLPNRGQVAVFGADPQQSVGSAPACFAEPNAAAEKLFEDLDVLCLVGHGSQFDMDLGDTAILCSKQGAKSRGDGLPCMQDDRCFRRLKRPNAELIDVRRLRARVLVLAGCNLALVGSGPKSANNALLEQWWLGSGVAALATITALRWPSGVELAALFHLLAGERLGTVVRALNRVRPSDAGVGPFVVFGNPCTRFGEGSAGLASVELPAESNFAVPMQDDIEEGRWGTMIAFDGPTQRRPWVARGSDYADWARGVACSDDDETELYVWVAPGASRNSTLEVKQAEAPDHMDLAMLDACRRRLASWPDLLDEFVEYHRNKGNPGMCEHLSSIVQLAPRARRLLRNLRRELVNPPDSFTQQDPPLAALLDTAVKGMQHAHRDLLTCCVESTLQAGFARATHLEYAICNTLEAARWELGPCACKKSMLAGRLYSDDLACHRWARGTCVCGGVGVDCEGDTYRLEFSGASSAFVRGERGQVRFRLPDSTCPLIVTAVMVLECWHRERRMVGQMCELVAPPGQEVTLDLDVDVPGDLTSGLYWATAFAIINGGLSLRAFYVNVV